MRHNLRPYATAGVVLIGAGLIAVTPAAAPLHNVAARVSRAVVLASDADLLAPWIDQFNTASANLTKMLNSFFEAPGVGVQQTIANQSDFAQQVLDDPSNINAVTEQMQSNFDAVVSAYGLQNADADTTSVVLDHTLDEWGPLNTWGHTKLFSEIPGYLPADQAATITPIINFLASPASGIIMGDLGPLISPWVALANSISDGDNANEILASMVGAFFNGATLNLDGLLPTINGLGLFPAGMAMDNLDIGFGGLLSAGAVGQGTDAISGVGVGGSIFNSVGIDLTGVPSLGVLHAPSQPVGPIGAWEGWGQIIATLLGWDGSGSPLADTTLPVVPTDPLDDGGASSAAATDLFTVAHDLLAAF